MKMLNSPGERARLRKLLIMGLVSLGVVAFYAVLLFKLPVVFTAW